jgi:DNA-binding beta-propeller fold protein YncE
MDAIMLARAGVIGVALAASTTGCSDYDSQVDAPGYAVEVVAREIRLVDGLAWHPNGALLATEEYKGGGLLKIDPMTGTSAYIVRDLADPDNIVVVDGQIYVSEEETSGRIVRIDSLERMHVFASGLDGPEGLDLGPDGRLYVAEHTSDGHVFSFTLDGDRKTLARVTNGEGLRVLPDGTVLVAETTESRVLAIDSTGDKSVFVAGINSPDGIAIDSVRGRVLVTEDASPGRLLSVDLASGELSTVATGLHAPQTMLVEPDGSILLAEQGEHRVLRLRPELEEEEP